MSHGLAARETTLTRELADATAAVDAANARTEDARAAAAIELRDRERDFEARLTHALDQRHTVEAQLAFAVERA